MVSKAELRSRRTRILWTPESETRRRSLNTVAVKCCFCAVRGTETRLKPLINVPLNETAVVVELLSSILATNGRFDISLKLFRYVLSKTRFLKDLWQLLLGLVEHKQ